MHALLHDMMKDSRLRPLHAAAHAQRRNGKDFTSTLPKRWASLRKAFAALPGCVYHHKPTAGPTEGRSNPVTPQGCCAQACREEQFMPHSPPKARPRAGRTHGDVVAELEAHPARNPRDGRAGPPQVSSGFGIEVAAKT